MLHESQQRLVEELAPKAVRLSKDFSVAIDYSCNPPSLAEVQSTPDGAMDRTEDVSICLGLFKVQRKQASRKISAETSNRKPLKTPKGGKKRSRR